MRIAVIGWYGHGNAGDERIFYCLKRFFGKDQIIPINGFAGIRDNREEINRCDYIFFGGGGQILRGTGKHASLFASLRPPFSCIGISVEAVHKDNSELLDVIKEKAEFILVRDRGSAEAFDHYSKVIVGPDLTFLYPFEPVEPALNGRCGVNLRPWRYWKGEHNGHYDLLMRRVSRRFPIVKKLYPLPKWKPDKAIAILRQNFSSLAPISIYSELNQTSDADEMRDYFTQVADTFSLQQIIECQMIVSMRLHALIFACQMGIPFISLSYMPKNVEFCKSIGLEQYSVDLFRLSQLKGAIRSLKDSYGKVRQHLLDVRAENHLEITALMNHLTKPITTRNCYAPSLIGSLQQPHR